MVRYRYRNTITYTVPIYSYNILYNNVHMMYRYLWQLAARAKSRRLPICCVCVETALVLTPQRVLAKTFCRTMKYWVMSSYLLAACLGGVLRSLFISDWQLQVRPCSANLPTISSTVAKPATQHGPAPQHGSAPYRGPPPQHGAQLVAEKQVSPTTTSQPFMRLNGACRTAEEKAGSYTLHSSMSEGKCASLCEQAVACVAFEISARGCEYHIEQITHADDKSPNTTCAIKRSALGKQRTGATAPSPNAAVTAAAPQSLILSRYPEANGRTRPMLPGVSEVGLREIVSGLAAAGALQPGTRRFLFTITTREAMPLSINLYRTGRRYGATIGAVTLLESDCTDLRRGAAVRPLGRRVPPIPHAIPTLPRTPTRVRAPCTYARTPASRMLRMHQRTPAHNCTRCSAWGRALSSQTRTPLLMATGSRSSSLTFLGSPSNWATRCALHTLRARARI